MTGEAIRCPHCLMGTAVEFDTLGAQSMPNRREGADAFNALDYGYCQNPECGRLIVRLAETASGGSPSRRFVVPHNRARTKFDGVPPEMVSDYEQACNVLDASPAASAALARRCLRKIIRGHFKVDKSRLYDEISGVVGSGAIPAYLADGLDKIRGIGNLSAHPTYDDRMGLIVDVSKSEAEWTLEIVEGLLKHCFVDPKEFEERTRRLRERIGGVEPKGEHKAG